MEKDIAICIQVRTRSERLKNKCFRKIKNKFLLEYCYKRLIKIEPSIPAYILTSNSKSDDKIADVARTYCKVGEIYEKQSEYDKSMEYLEKALPMQLKEFGTEEHVDVAKTYHLMGWTCSQLRKDDQAMEYCMKSLKIRLKVLDEGHVDVAELYDIINTVMQELLGVIG